MASPQVTVRLDADTYKLILALAQTEKKTIAEMTRDLIERGLGKQTTTAEEVTTRLQFLEANISELIAKAVIGSARAAYYAELSAQSAEETAHFVTTGGQVLDGETRQQRSLSRLQKAKAIGQEYLNKQLGQL